MRFKSCRLSLIPLLAIAISLTDATSIWAADGKKIGKVLMPIGDATETMDTLYPFFRLAEEGYEVVVAGPEARLYNMVLHEVPPNCDVRWDLTEETKGYHIKANIAFKDIKPEEYAGIFLSGGRAPEYLRYDKDLIRVIQHFVKEDKPIAVVCPWNRAHCGRWRTRRRT